MHDSALFLIEFGCLVLGLGLGLLGRLAGRFRFSPVPLHLLAGPGAPVPPGGHETIEGRDAVGRA